jgi:hypothetical protein
MAAHTDFELEVLGWVVDDYEAPHTIAGDIARVSGNPTTEGEVRIALLALAESGLVQAFAYDARGNRYGPITYREAVSANDAWYMATAAGKAEFERHAN